MGRMHYLIEPGLYALGDPDERSPVLVTANYKLSFDRLRSALPGRDAWILVADTDGINVWCAAGKRTFCTEEVVRRIQAGRLDQVVTHRTVILPQLCAPGVAAFRVKKLSGFRAMFGPIRAEDLPAFLDQGLRAAPAMRRKTFPLAERAVLIPVELVQAARLTILAGAVLFFLAGLGGGRPYWTEVLTAGVWAAAALAAALISGVVVTPLLLPWLPGRAFSIKGLVAGALPALGLAGAVFIWRTGPFWSLAGEAAAWLLIVPALSAFWAMNFTGASTFTSLSGVKREMRRAVPLQVLALALGLGLWLAARFLA